MILLQFQSDVIVASEVRGLFIFPKDLIVEICYRGLSDESTEYKYDNEQKMWDDYRNAILNLKSVQLP